jgi:voltage-gated potassium channel Kch
VIPSSPCRVLGYLATAPRHLHHYTRTGVGGCFCLTRESIVDLVVIIVVTIIVIVVIVIIIMVVGVIVALAICFDSLVSLEAVVSDSSKSWYII